MTAADFAALCLLAFPACFSPGVNNTLVMASVLRFGMRATLPHIIGIVFGFPLQLFVVGVALAELFRRSPMLQQTLKVFGAVLLLWLAWKIWTKGGLTSPEGRVRPFRFHEAAAFQWINPKSWTLAVSVTSQFVRPDRPGLSALVVALVFGAGVLCSNLVWGGAGGLLRGAELSERAMRWVNRLLAILLVFTVGLLLTGGS